MYRFLKSVPLAVSVILLLTVLSLTSTLVPQGKAPPWYRETYGSLVASAITALDFDHFFSSLLFIAPAMLLALSLGVCTVDRVTGRFRTGAQKRYGPDIVHNALLVLIAGALVTALGRHERFFLLSQGQMVDVTGRYSIRLLSLESLKYPNGLPRAWISTVEVRKDGALETASYEIRVNHPLRLRGVSIYQASWDDQSTFLFREAGGAETMARIGDAFRDGDTLWFLADVADQGGAILQQYRGATMISERTLAVNESLGPYTLVTVTPRVATGLQAVEDPGFGIVIVGIVLLAGGLALTFVQGRAVEPARSAERGRKKVPKGSGSVI